DAVAAFTGWIAYLDLEFTRHLNPELRSEIVRDELHQLYMGHAYAGKLNSTMVTEQGLAVLQFTLDPRNATLEPEYYGDIDVEKYAVIKPLIWFWQMFDRSPVGLNQWLGFRFRAMLGRHIFRHLGQNVTFFHGVEFTFGYNLTIADNCILHKNVLLDDRNELLIPEGSSISDSTRVSSHTYNDGIVPNGTVQALAD
ncbi:MAG: acyltransferase, partial [Acidobacteriaceae bacterium]